MSDEAASKSGKVWLWVTALALMAPVAYLLMAGPAAVLFKRGILAEEPVQLFYGSFDRAIHDTRFYPAWEAYLNAWLGVTGTTK